MVKSTFTILGILAILVLSLMTVSAATFIETFENSNATWQYKNESFPGDNSITWSFIESRDAGVFNISGGNDMSLMFKDTTSKITSSSISGGIASFSVKLKKAYASIDNRQVELFINGVSQGTSAEFNDTTTHDFTVNNLNIEGAFVIELRNTKNQQIVIDNIAWTNYTAPVTPPTPTTYEFCDDFSGRNGTLEITSFDVINNGAGDDTEWEYLDEVEVEVTVENTGSNNVNDVLVEMKVVDDRGNIITKKKMGLSKDKIDLGRINDGDEEIATFKISELPINLDNGDYKIYVRAYDEKNKDFECASTSNDFTDNDNTYFKFEIVPSDGATVIVKRNLDNVLASCGDKNVEVKFKVYNTGSDNEDKVLVTLENSKLGINEKTVINNLRNGKEKEATFFISIPEEVTKTLNKLKIYTYYDYDKDKDELDESAYGESSEAEGDGFSTDLEILSCKSLAPTIDANLESVAEVGKELIIKTTITNNGKDNDFVISASDFGAWAELVSVTPQTASIKKGEYAEVTITLRPTATGAQSFNINTIVDGESYKQSVSVSIDEKPGLFAGIDDITLYAIVGIIVLLIVIFLVLVLKASGRPKKPEF